MQFEHHVACLIARWLVAARRLVEAVEECWLVAAPMVAGWLAIVEMVKCWLVALASPNLSSTSMVLLPRSDLH